MLPDALTSREEPSRYVPHLPSLPAHHGRPGRRLRLEAERSRLGVGLLYLPRGVRHRLHEHHRRRRRRLFLRRGSHLFDRLPNRRSSPDNTQRLCRRVRLQARLDGCNPSILYLSRGSAPNRATALPWTPPAASTPRGLLHRAISRPRSPTSAASRALRMPSSPRSPPLANCADGARAGAQQPARSGRVRFDPSPAAMSPRSTRRIITARYRRV